MKSLVVMRHATAGQASSDYDRPLTSGGISDVAEAAKELKSLMRPQMFLVSGSLRTRMTAKEVNNVFHLDDSLIAYDDRIYEASCSDLIGRLREISPSIDNVLMIGHNPGVSMLVSSFTGVSCRYSPGSFALITFDVDNWSDVQRGLLQSHYSPS
jgi:phosphohistidine phosphatase